jgi:membrane-associated phospholipid phosphatase
MVIAVPRARGADAASASVYQVRPVTDAIVTTAAFVGYTAPLLLQDGVVDTRCPCDRGEVNALDRGVIGNSSVTAARVSDATVALAIVVPVTLDAWVLGWSKPLLEDAVVFAQTMFINGSLVNATKLIVQRPRPATYAGAPGYVDDSEGYLSFYSGHASSAFAALGAMSMTVGYRYGSWVLPWIVTGLVGTSVAVERVVAGRHFYTDVGTGALAGLALGIAVPWLHRRGGMTLTAPPVGSVGLGLSGRM